MNAINWFEIPVQDLDRATRFYEQMLGRTLRKEVFGGAPMAVFKYDETAVGGALIKEAQRKPSRDGTLPYLATQELDTVLGRVAKAGGRVVTPKTDIGDPGFIALIEDSEGNVVGLHQPR